MTVLDRSTVLAVRQAAHPAAPALPTVPVRYEPGTGDWAMLLSRAKTACDCAQWLLKQSQERRASARVLIQESADRRRTRLHGQPSGPRRDLLQRSAYLRLLARLETMPVIEQAKGILMAQSRCGDTEAFDLLRRASQRSNVPVRELAAQIVANTVRASQAADKAG